MEAACPVTDMDPRIIAHGGAGPTTINEVKQQAVNDIAERGYERLRDGASAIDTVESVVRDLEAYPGFNAGYGSKLQADGLPRPEASIMTQDRDYGAAIGLDKIQHPVTVARLVMEETPHSILAGDQAVQFALDHGLDRHALITEERHEEWVDAVGPADTGTDTSSTGTDPESSSNTVGCVALDSDGNIASATSTGGLTGQMAGRVGDTPIIGGGIYCDDQVAVSTTGNGEAILETLFARRIAEQYRDQTLSEAVQSALTHLESSTGKYAGAITISTDGEVAVDYTDKMYYAGYPAIS